MGNRQSEFIKKFRKNDILKTDIKDYLAKNGNYTVRSIFYNKDRKHVIIELTNIDFSNLLETYADIRKKLMETYQNYEIRDTDISLTARKQSVCYANGKLSKKLVF